MEGPIKRLVHKIMFFIVVVTALIFLLQFIYAGLKFKYWLIYLGYLVVHSLNTLKGVKANQQVVHYKDEVYHVLPLEEHHYTGGWQEEDNGSSRWSIFG